MSSVKEHYDNHLGNFYSWMVGDFNTQVGAFENLLDKHDLGNGHGKAAIDLGAGHGIQSVAMAGRGYEVCAIDFNQSLLEELKVNAKKLPVNTNLDDIRNVNQYKKLNPHVIACCTDTVLHLDSREEIEHLIQNCKNLLPKEGSLILSFRDYSIELVNEQRFIPVKSDSNRIHTCLLEYEPDRVKVTDLLYERKDGSWAQKVSFYYKIRMIPSDMFTILEKQGFQIVHKEVERGMHIIIAR